MYSQWIIFFWKLQCYAFVYGMIHSQLHLLFFILAYRLMMSSYGTLIWPLLPPIKSGNTSQTTRDSTLINRKSFIYIYLYILVILSGYIYVDVQLCMYVIYKYMQTCTHVQLLERVYRSIANHIIHGLNCSPFLKIANQVT